MDNLDEKILLALNDLTEAVKENNELIKNGSAEEFLREVSANIYADILMGYIFSGDKNLNF